MKSFFGFVFFSFFFSFMAVHFAYMKTPAQHRIVASETESVRPLYDASWKI